jgi:hypothetical protein
MYWAKELATQTDDKELAASFAPLAKAFADNEEKIVSEFKAVQGHRVDIGGYYKVDPDKVKGVMRPSATFNSRSSLRRASLKSSRGHGPFGADHPTGRTRRHCLWWIIRRTDRGIAWLDERPQLSHSMTTTTE